MGRLAKLAETVFGTKPIVITLPYQETVSARTAAGRSSRFSWSATGHSRAVIDPVEVRVGSVLLAQFSAPVTA